MYFERVLTYLSDRYCFDPLRVHAVGLSNGGEMVYRLACEMSDRIASIAVISGAFTNSLLSGCLVPCAAGDPYHMRCYSADAAAGCAAPHQPPTPLVYSCTNQVRRVPLLAIHGALDDALPISGGRHSSVPVLQNRKCNG